MIEIPAVLEISSLVINIVAILTILIKPIREWVFGMKEVREGQRCILRSEMLSIYYDGKDHDCKIRQHEYENFMLMYKAYKAMKGNSFIDKIYQEVQKMEVVT